jgi:hypothetical protein
MNKGMIEEARPVKGMNGTPVRFQTMEIGGVVHPGRAHPFTTADFAPPCINTTGWKFNREEANER